MRVAVMFHWIAVRFPLLPRRLPPSCFNACRNNRMPHGELELPSKIPTDWGNTSGGTLPAPASSLYCCCSAGMGGSRAVAPTS